MNDHATMRANLVSALKALGVVGGTADAMLLAEEETRSINPTAAHRADETRLQVLAALSRQIWAAHLETQRAIAGIDKLGETDEERSE